MESTKNRIDSMFGSRCCCFETRNRSDILIAKSSAVRDDAIPTVSDKRNVQ